MALIICKECGGKISDTCAICIHCGAPVNKEQFEEEQSCDFEKDQGIDEEDVLQDLQTDIYQEKQTDNTSTFGSLTQDEKTSLENEFLKQDQWAYRYLRQKTEFKKFRRSLYFFLGMLCLFVGLVRIFVGEKVLLLDYLIANPAFLVASLASFVALCLLFFAMFLYGIIGPIIFIAKHKKYRYSKKFMLWLKQEKNITYNPPLVFKYQKKIFDKININ